MCPYLKPANAQNLFGTARRNENTSKWIEENIILDFGLRTSKLYFIKENRSQIAEKVELGCFGYWDDLGKWFYTKNRPKKRFYLGSKCVGLPSIK